MTHARNPASATCVRHAAAAVSLCVALALATAASANPFALLGYDVESGALANSNVSFGSSLGVLYTNPALLADVGNQAGIAVTFNLPRLDVKLQAKPQSSRIPTSIYDSSIGNMPGLQDRALPAAELLNPASDNEVRDVNAYLGVGMAYNFGVRRFQLGVLAQLPISSWNSAEVATHFNDEREANFSNKIYLMRFGQWERIAAVLAGAAYSPLPWLDVGVGAQVSLAAKVRLKLYIPDATVQDYSQSNVGSEIAGALRPVAGLRFRPLDWLAVGAAWRNESYVSMDGGGGLDLWNYHEPVPDKLVPKRTTQKYSMALDYEPMEISVGVGVKLREVTTQVAVMWQQWSQYLDHHAAHAQSYAEFPSSPFLPVLSDGAYDPTNGGAIDADEYRFNNTFNVQWSGQWRFKEWGEASLGACWYPTPAPAQLGRTNFADNDLLGITAGSRFDFNLLKLDWTLAVNLQVWQMFERTTYKDPAQVYDEFPDAARTLVANNPMSEAAGLQTNNPGYPGYEAGGILVATGFSLMHRF
ncbi:MAG: hypothetical protein HY897_00940 [Deltaproteobacteria bacterium]|nr:hypothetical protein [Deltaproteobacteria bacterium]